MNNPIISKEKQNELRQRFNPEGSDLRRQQLRMMELLLAFDKICKKHNIRYWLIAGTLIGAARHHGFIPWDDDMDVQMLREDYERMLEILPQELDDTMALQCRQTDPISISMPNCATAAPFLTRTTATTVFSKNVVYILISSL